MESWREVWREGVAPLIPEAGLAALEKGLIADDPRLVQSSTCLPSPHWGAKWPCQGACPIAFAGWQGDGLDTVAEVNEFFSTVCLRIDQRFAEPLACRWFLNWWDETPRADARAALLPEVQAELARRGAAH